MNVEEIIKELQKIPNKKLPASVYIQSNLPFTYEVIGVQLESQLNVNNIFDDSENGNDKKDRVYFLVQIRPR